MTKTRFSLRLIFCVFSILLSANLPAQQQQLVFAGLRAVAGQGQFNAVQSAPNGDLYLLLDQKDGVRLLKTDATATNVLAQAQLGTVGDIGLAMALDPSGNVYITGTTTSNALTATLGATFPNRTGTSTNSFIAKFDANLNPLFVTFAGSDRMAVAAIAATSGAVFITGSLFAATLPVTPNAIIPAPASGSFQNGFVEKFSTNGDTLLYATYLSGANGDTAPAAIAADASGNAYLAGYTTSRSYPTFAALIPEILGPTSGFLTKLTPAGDGVAFSTYIPGSGITSVALDAAARNLLLSGTIALGQFPVATVAMPLVNTPYQTLLRIPLDGSAVLSSVLLAPGTQSFIAPEVSGSAWAIGTLTTPILSLPTLSTLGNSFALRVNAQNMIDQAMRFGGLPASNPAYASVPVTLTSLAIGTTGQPIFAGTVTPTASSSLLATQTFDLPLYNVPTGALPSTVHGAVLSPGTCNGSLCAGSAAFLAEMNPLAGAPSLALSTDNSPNINLRNLGSVTATGVQLNTAGFTLATNCAATLSPGAECSIVLSGPGPGTLTVQAANAATQTATLPASIVAPDAVVFSPKELDFGVQTSASPATQRTLTLTNLSQQSQTFASAGSSTQFAEQSSDCTASGTSKLLAPGGTCHITFSFTASSDSASDGIAQSNWTIGPGSVLLTGYAQAAALTLSASEIDFGTQYAGGLRLPRFLYLSNNSASPIPHTAVSLTFTSPFTVTDRCPSQLLPHTVCQIELGYLSRQSPSNDSTTLSLDQGLTVLITGKTLPQPGAGGATVNPNLTVTPTALNFPNTVPVTATSSATETVTIGNTGPQPLPLALSLSGDFTDATSCGATLPGNSTCTAVITFAPSQPGTRQGLLTVVAGFANTPAYVTLSGTATPILASNNGTLDFGSVIIGQPVVQWYKIIESFSTLTASILGANFKTVLVEDIGYGHGQPSTSAFSSTTTGSCANCWLGIQFQPTTSGAQAATVNLSSSATGNAEPVTLTGNGLPLTGLILSPTSRDFGPIPVNSTSAPTLFTLTNLTSATVTITPPITSGDFSVGSATSGGAACNGPLNPTASCFIQVAFNPSAPGTRGGILTIQTTASTLSVPLAGFGAPDPGLSLSPTSLIFNNVPGTTSTQQIVTLKNTGAAVLQIGTPTVASASFAPSTSCVGLTPGAACTITVIFTPSTADTTDTLSIPVTSSNGGSTTYAVPLTSAYTAEDSGLQIIPNEANFGPQSTGSPGLTRQFTINNLTAKSLTLSLALPRQFVLAQPPCVSLAPNASCTFSVTFLPLTNGDITGTLFAQATPADGSPALNSLGYVEGYGLGSGTLAVSGNLIPTGGQGSLVDFGQVASGQSSSQTLTITNHAASPITVRRILSEWPFLSSSTCGATLVPNQACIVTVTYSPLNQAPVGNTSPLSNTDTGTLVIESDALTSPELIDLTGTAAPILVSSPGNTAPLVSFTSSQSSLTFPSTSVGNVSPVQTIALSNTGTRTIHIAALQTTPDFSVAGNCTTLVAGASCTLNLTFTPQLPGARISALEISSDSSTALDFVSLLGSATPSSLSFSPASLDFGTVLVGSTSQLPVQVTNSSNTPAIFNGIAATGDYASSGSCPAPGGTLAPSTSCMLQATFTPTHPGIRAGVLKVSNSLSTLPLTVALTGIGAQSHLQANPSSFNFGSLALAASANLALSLSNTGNASITNLALAITGDYAITTPCALSTLATGASCSVTLTFTPTTLGTRPGTLTVISSDANSPTILPLTGTGVPNGTFTLTASGNPTASVTVKSGSPANYPLTLTPKNNFSGTVVLNCTPITPGQYASCSLLPSSIALSEAAQNAAATIDTITSKTDNTAQGRHPFDGTLLYLLPAALVFFWRTTPNRTRLCTLLMLMATAFFLIFNGCGSGGTLNLPDPNLRKTPPGTYQYQITATATTGLRITQTVTLNLIVK